MQKFAEKIKMYAEKLECKSVKVTSATEEQNEYIKDVVKEDYSMCSCILIWILTNSKSD